MKKNFNFYKCLLINAFKTCPWLLLIICAILFSCPDVFAASQNISSKIEATPNFGGGTYYATQPVSVPVPLYQNVGTRYNGKLSLIEFYLDNTAWSWNYNKTYTITLNMATDDWRNNFMGPQVIQCNCDGSQQSTSTSKYVSNTFRFVSYKSIKFNFKLGSTMGCKTKFRIYSSNTSSVAITGVSNYNLSSITISDTTTAPTPTPLNPVITPTPAPGNQDIINNNNQNTQEIINNQSQNTQDIIDNNSQNTSDIIENNNQNSQNIIDNQNQLLGSQCSNIFNFNSSKNVGSGASNVTFGDDYISFTGNSSNVLGSNFIIYTLSLTPNTNYYFKLNNGYQISLLNSSYSTIFNTSFNSFEFNSGNNSTVLLAFFSPQNQTTRYSNVMVSTVNKSFCVFDSYTSKIDETTNAINQQNEYLMDNSNPNIADNEFTSLFDSVSFNDPLSYLLQLPVQFINAIVNQSNSCQVVNLGTLLGVSITLPCIDIGSILGSSVWNTIDVIFSVCLLVVIFKNLYQTFANLITLGGEKQAREKFSMPTPMEFLSLILGGDR